MKQLPVYRRRTVRPIFHITNLGVSLMNAIDWNTYAKAYDLLRSIKPYRAMHDAVGAAIKQHHVHGGGFILDAGCGTGNLLTTLSEHDIPRACMVGIDAAPA